MTAAVCHDGDDILKIPPIYRVTDLEWRSGRSIGIPLKSKMLIPIILNAVAANPGIPYHYLRELLSSYVRAYALTGRILQEAHDLAKKQLFGRAEQNVQYAKGLLRNWRDLGIMSEFCTPIRRRLCRQCVLLLYEKN